MTIFTDFFSQLTPPSKKDCFYGLSQEKMDFTMILSNQFLFQCSLNMQYFMITDPLNDEVNVKT